LSKSQKIIRNLILTDRTPPGRLTRLNGIKMVFTDNNHHTTDTFQVQPRTFDGLTYQTDSLTVNLVPIIATMAILYLIRVFTLLGGDFDDFMDLTMNAMTGGGHSSTYDAMDATYAAPLSGGYDAPSSNYNAPQTSYNAPQTSYNAPQTSYNAPQTSYNSPQAQYGRVDFGIDPKNQIEAFDPTSSVQNDVTLTNEELTLYNQLLLANNYQLDPRNPEVYF